MIADSEFSMLHEHNSLAVKPLVPEMEELTSFLKTILKKFNLWFYTLFQIICKLLCLCQNFKKKGVLGRGKWPFHDQLNFICFTVNLLKEIVKGIRSPEAENVRMNREASMVKSNYHKEKIIEDQRIYTDQVELQ